MSAQKNSYFTPEQYLEMERKAAYKSEYFRGEIFAMAGAKIRHNAIKDNLVASMMTFLRGKGCRTFSSDQRILTATEAMVQEQ
jgi:Uma2 family endonuclease